MAEIIIMVVDEVPQCSNPHCENEAIGMIDHPGFGFTAICGECLEMLRRISKVVEATEGEADAAGYERAMKMAAARFN